MNTTLKTGLSTLTIALATAFLAGCGGGSSHDTLPPTNPPVTQAQGKAVDFYLSGATVTFEDCTGKPTAITTAEGGFAYPAVCNNVPTALTISGGVDIGTNLPFTGVLKTPKVAASALNIASPLTTLIANAPDAASGAAIAAKLGITGTSATLLTVDPMTNAALLKQTVVVQQFVDQVQKVLLQLSASAGGALTAEQAAQAASAALAASVTSSTNTGVADLTSATFAQGAIGGAIRGAAANLPDSIKNNIDIVARNTAALAAAEIAEKVSAVNTAMASVTIGANPADTLTKLGGNLQTIKDSATSAGGANLIDTLYAALGNPNISAELLTQLGTAAASGASVEASLSSVNSLIVAAGGAAVPAGDLANLDQYKDFIELVSFGTNSKETFTIPAVEKSVITGQELSVATSLNTLQLKLNKNGAPFTGNTTNARVGVTYTINGNELNFIITNVTMTFNDAGTLSSVVVPAKTSYNFQATAGSTEAKGNYTNESADNLSVNNGVLSLPFDDFLNRVARANTNFNKALFTPKVGDKVKVKVALNSLVANPAALRVGLVESAKARAATSVTVNTETTTLSGQGVDAVISVK